VTACRGYKRGNSLVHDKGPGGGMPRGKRQKAADNMRVLPELQKILETKNRERRGKRK